MKIGLNLYSLRTYIKTEENFLDTAKKLKAMGYDYLQYSGAPLNADVIKRVSEATGMPIVLTHTSLEKLLNESESLMEEHRKFGCDEIGMGYLPIELAIDEQKCKDSILKLNEVGKRMVEQGFTLGYHNHAHEFLKYDGQTLFDYMIENAPYINFIVDTYWLQFGGVDVLETLDKLKGRVKCAHLKDYRLEYKEDLKNVAPRFAPIGDGTLNFKAIIEKMREIGVEYYLVEQDDAISYENPFEQVERSVRYIKANF